jgi:hypothetical protein
VNEQEIAAQAAKHDPKLVKAITAEHVRRIRAIIARRIAEAEVAADRRHIEELKQIRSDLITSIQGAET